MKRSILTLLSLAILIMTSLGLAFAADPLDESISRGKSLFNNENLGANTSGMSCNSCHPNGKTTGGSISMGKMDMAVPTLIGVATTFPKYKAGANKVVSLEQMNNMCIAMIMKGKSLDLESQDAVDLAAYVTSLSYGKKMQKGKTVMMKM